MKAARWRRNGFIVAFLSPAVLLYAFFVIIPFLQTFQLSFTRFSGASSKRKFVGWENYQYLMKDEVLWASFKNVAILLGVAGPIIFILSLLLAHAVSGDSRGAKVIRAIYLFPQIISIVAVAVLWRFIYHPTGGILKGIGIDGPQDGWLGTTSTAFWCVCVAFIWVSLGFYTMLFSAGIRSMPKEVLEACELEGARGWKKFAKVTWPMLFSLRRVAAVYVAIHVMATFALVNVMTDGNPADSTQVPLNYMVFLMHRESDFGGASALAAMNFFVVLAVSLVVMFLFRRNPEESRTR